MTVKRADMGLALCYLNGVLYVEQVDGLWWAQFGNGPRFTGLTALRAVNAAREYHDLWRQRRLTGRRCFQVYDRKPYHKRAVMKAAGSQQKETPKPNT